MSMNVSSIAFFPLRSAAFEETVSVGKKGPASFEEKVGFEEKQASAAFEETVSVGKTSASFEETVSVGKKFYA